MGRRRQQALGGVVWAFLLALLVVALGAAVYYLLSDINTRRYRIATRQGQLVVERGLFAPYGFHVFAPDAKDLRDAYAPMMLPPNESLPTSVTYDDRADLDRALFALLAGWARERMESHSTVDFELAVGYATRAELLPGLSEEQRRELRRLRADVTYREARLLVADITERLTRALGRFRESIALGTSQAADAERWIVEIERRLHAYNDVPREAPPPPVLSAPLVPTDEAQAPRWRP
ncbi:MAG: hypothetical protein AAB426_11400 [Myxococcota bacterium]